MKSFQKVFLGIIWFFFFQGIWPRSIRHHDRDALEASGQAGTRARKMRTNHLIVSVSKYFRIYVRDTYGNRIKIRASRWTWTQRKGGHLGTTNPLLSNSMVVLRSTYGAIGSGTCCTSTCCQELFLPAPSISVWVSEHNKIRFDGDAIWRDLSCSLWSMMVVGSSNATHTGYISP